jgi:aryl-alcohol dehydrogenase-like predicted oxidoreductase
MRLRPLGRTGLQVSELTLGCMSFGEQRPEGFFDPIQTDVREATRLVDLALDSGVNLFDTADIYGDGASEEILGRALGPRRRSVFIATKAGGPMGNRPDQAGLSHRYLMSACEASLQRLRTDYVDLYQVHYPDPQTPLDETLRALDDLVRSGKVRHVGASNFGAYLLTKGLWLSDRANGVSFSSLQVQYNLLLRDIEDEILPLCKEEGIGVLVWGPLASGFLSGKYRRGQPLPRESRLAAWKHMFQRYDTDEKWRAIEELMRIAASGDVTPSQLAIQWLLARPISSVIVGARTVAQLEDNLRADERPVPVGALEKLTALSLPAPRYPFGKFSPPTRAFPRQPGGRRPGTDAE